MTTIPTTNRFAAVARAAAVKFGGARAEGEDDDAKKSKKTKKSKAEDEECEDDEDGDDETAKAARAARGFQASNLIAPAAAIALTGVTADADPRATAQKIINASARTQNPKTEYARPYGAIDAAVPDATATAAAIILAGKKRRGEII